MTKMQQRGRGMRSFVLSLAVLLAVTGPGFAQSNTAGTATTPQVIRGSSANAAVKKTAAVASQPNVVRPPARQVQQPPQQRSTTPETLRGSRYGGFAPAPCRSPCS